MTDCMLLACCLKQENVCQPIDFLPQKIFREITREAVHRAKALSPTNWYYGALVDSWKPYFERLLGDLRHTEKKIRRVEDKLVSEGMRGRRSRSRCKPDYSTIRQGFLKASSRVHKSQL
jgi:hypothetical protein